MITNLISTDVLTIVLLVIGIITLILSIISIYLSYRTKKRYEARIVLDDELVANYISRDYTELNHTLYDLEKVLGKDMYVIYILRTAYEVTFENIATLLDTNRENVRRKYLQSVKIVEEFLEE